MELFLNNSYVGIIHTHTHTHIYIVRCVSVCVSGFSCVQLFVTLQTVAHQAPLSMGFSRQEYWSGLPCPPPGDLPDPGLLHLLHRQAGSLPTSATWEAHFTSINS